MTKFEETKILVETYTEMAENGIKVGINPILLDIAVSLSIIADKLNEEVKKR